MVGWWKWPMAFTDDTGGLGRTEVGVGFHLNCLFNLDLSLKLNGQDYSLVHKWFSAFWLINTFPIHI